MHEGMYVLPGTTLTMKERAQAHSTRSLLGPALSPYMD